MGTDKSLARYFISAIREIRGLDREAFLIQDQADRERQDEPCDRNDERVIPVNAATFEKCTVEATLARDHGNRSIAYESFVFVV